MKLFLVLFACLLFGSYCQGSESSDNGKELCIVHKQFCKDDIANQFNVDCSLLEGIECGKDNYDAKLIEDGSLHRRSKRSTYSKCGRFFSGLKSHLYFCTLTKSNKGCRNYGKCSWYCTLHRNQGKCNSNPLSYLLADLQ